MYALDLPLTSMLPTLGVSLAATSPGLVASPLTFISTGYGGAIAAIGAWNMAAKGFDKLPLTASLHNVAMALFGLRLAAFLQLRSQQDSYNSRQEMKDAMGKFSKMGLKARLMMWVPCSALYVMMAAPAFATTGIKAEIPISDPVFAVGLATMVVGGLLEAVADYQKTALKKKDPKAFGSTGVFRICRHPSYLGEVLFWVGNYIAGLPAMGLDLRYQLLAGTGLMGILSIMTSASKRLIGKQEEKYGKREDWKKYASEVKGALFPKLF